MTTYEDRSRGLDDLDVAISKVLSPVIDCKVTYDELAQAVRALVERREREALRGWHPDPRNHDYFHDYGDCGGNLIDGCGFRAKALEGKP